MNIQLVPQNYTAQIWPQIEHFLEPAQKFGGEDYTLEQVKMFVNMGQWALVIATDAQNIVGAMTVTLLNEPNNRVAYVTTTGGKMICTEESLVQLKEIMKGLGATKLQAGGRKSIVRLLQKLGFKERYTVVQTDI